MMLCYIPKGTFFICTSILFTVQLYQTITVIEYKSPFVLCAGNVILAHIVMLTKGYKALTPLKWNFPNKSTYRAEGTGRT